MKRLSIVIPCYNEAANLPLLLERFSRAIQRDDVEVILVNNGSTDDSAEVLQHLLPLYPFARCVEVPINQGYGYGILAGLAAAQGTFLGWTHADLQTDPNDVLLALDRLQPTALPDTLYLPETVYVKGQRRGRRLFDNLFTLGMSLFESLLLQTPLWDINAQPNLFHRRFYETWQAPPHDFSLDLYVYYLAKRQGLRVRRLNVQFPPRIHGESSWNTGLAAKWKFIQRTVRFSLSLRKNIGRHSLGSVVSCQKTNSKGTPGASSPKIKSQTESNVQITTQTPDSPAVSKSSYNRPQP
ncbi:MAG: glycosyltransferase family 2 protein [Candidatus Melainabacteria bacterium]|nr:glycosyltransferase family 2 protein [Candidatus Melainabacteria bacterium]